MQAYEKSDHDGRRMIQLFAQLSIIDGEGVQAVAITGRFESPVSLLSACVECVSIRRLSSSIFRKRPIRPLFLL